MRLIVCLIALFLCDAHIIIDDVEKAWEYGWYAKDLAITMLILYIAYSEKEYKTKSILYVFFVWSLVELMMEVSGGALDNMQFVAVASMICFTLWSIKQILIRAAESDAFTYDNYMYALAPVENIYGCLNASKVLSVVEYGGRVIVAGEYVYCLHRGKFKKFKTSQVNLNKYTLIDTKERINQKTSARLDAKVNEKAALLLNDCSSLSVEHGLNYVVFARALGRCQLKTFGRKSPHT